MYRCARFLPELQRHFWPDASNCNRQLAQEVTEWVLHPRKSNHAEYGRVYISANPIMPSAEEFFNSKYRSKKIEIELT